MDLYLMQHGLAVPAEVDPDRPLTDSGAAEVAAVSRHAASHSVRVDRVVHSGKRRAAQTAGILAEALGCARVDAEEGLRPGDPVAPLAGRLAGPGSGPLAIVGHLPSLDRLASLLVAGDEDAHVVDFRNAGLVHLVAVGRGGPTAATIWTIRWILTPEVVG